jgi:ribosome recycling factor
VEVTIVKSVLKETRERMQKSLEAFEHNISAIRTGRANPAVLNRIHVNYYGAQTPLNQLASISSPDARTLVITPFDKSIVGEIEKAILESDLGFNPNNRGDSIFIAVPPLTDERRKELVKVVRTMAEEARVAVRNIRRDANEELKVMQKEGELTEDELRSGENEVQKLTDEFIAAIDKRVKSKEEDILAV